MRGKLDASHLERRAFVYVRQSTTRQVFEHGESTARQYALADRAVTLGWPRHAVEVIDEDLGRSGATADQRSGFARLAEAVAHGRAGAVLAIEVSRLARSSVDWQRLLSVCAVAGVVVIDEHTVYDPKDKDDKLLLDLKGTMSEAELHWLRLRLAGAQRSKAQRGALRLALPTGYVWGENGIELDPDQAVQAAIRTVFERFSVEPTAWAVVRWARQTGFLMPTRRAWAGGGSELRWVRLGTTRLCSLLHNPVYAGTYAYGRRPEEQVLVEGEIRRVRRGIGAPETWAVCLRDAHPGYISWETYLANVEKLRDNDARFRGTARGAPREGHALLVGIAICGRCGRRMRASYRGAGSHSWRYTCCGERGEGGPTCWVVSGSSIDAAVSDLLLKTVVPNELELCLAVEKEATAQAESLAEQWRLRIEKAEYEARRAERRYKAVDPDNRVVARTLEREWEQRLCELEEVKTRYHEARRVRRVDLSETDRTRIRSLARDLPAVWQAPTTAPADRKAMLRLVIEAVSLRPVELPARATCIEVQWQSGAVTELHVARPARKDAQRTPDEAVSLIRELAATGAHDPAIATRLNEGGLLTGAGKRWDERAVSWARRRNGIKAGHPHLPKSAPLPDRRSDGRYSVPGAARHLGVTVAVVRGWLKRGLVPAVREDHGSHRNVWWLEIDERTRARLGELSWRSRPRL